MTYDELTKEQLEGILEAAADLIDGEFHEAREIHRNTGLPMERCEEMEVHFRVLRSLSFKHTCVEP
jgi:hypothetical protein